jgi:DNA-binding LytR/AlgR family response regulator
LRSSLNGAMEKLPEGMFIRIHESTAVSVSYIVEIYKEYVVLSGLEKETKTIGKTFYYSVLDALRVIGRHDGK